MAPKVQYSILSMKYEYLVTLMYLKNAFGSFQFMSNEKFRVFTNYYIVFHINDFPVFSKDEDKHIEGLNDDLVR